MSSLPAPDPVASLPRIFNTTPFLPLPDLHPLIKYSLSATSSPVPPLSPSPPPPILVPARKKLRQKSAKPFVLDDQPLVLFQSQRGKHLLVFENFTFSKNNTVGDTTYWACRVVTNHVKCKARASTTRKPNGLFRIMLGNATHNHLPKMTHRMLVQSANDNNVFYMKG